MDKKKVPVPYGKNKFIDRDGYVLVPMPKNEHKKFKPMYGFKNMGYEHRINMAKKIGRPLFKHEHVNHIDKNRQNNLIHNLELIGALEHLRQHREKGDFKLFTSEYNPSLKEKKDKLETLSKINPKELARGILTESEHKPTVGNSPNIYANIALDHLKEDPNYYKKLTKMEKKTKLQKNASILSGGILKGITQFGSKTNLGLNKLTQGGGKIFSNKIMGGLNKVTNFAKNNPKGFTSAVTGLGGAAIGGVAGMAKDPGRDEEGNKKSRLGNIGKGMLMGGGLGYALGRTASGRAFGAGFGNPNKVKFPVKNPTTK